VDGNIGGDRFASLTAKSARFFVQCSGSWFPEPLVALGRLKLSRRLRGCFQRLSAGYFTGLLNRFNGSGV
jgi:hypothetical protein